MGVAARVSPPPAFTGARGRAESVAANADLSCWNRRAVASELSPVNSTSSRFNVILKAQSRWHRNWIFHCGLIVKAEPDGWAAWRSGQPGLGAEENCRDAAKAV